MLQQTQVERVAPRYEEFFRRWPDVRAFAGSSLADVLRFWTGLGYNRRARHLHAAARIVAGVSGGAVPKDADGLRALPGVGAYTAAAVLAFACNVDTPVCDTNTKRIFLRYFWGGEFAERLPPPAALLDMMAAALPAGSSREWHSALMDLGSAVCTGRTPDCGSCPLRRRCRAAEAFVSGACAPRHRLVRPQERFEGSRRQARGALIRELAGSGSAGLSPDDLGRMFPGTDIEAVARTLLEEGLIEEHGGGFRLPE